MKIVAKVVLSLAAFFSAVPAFAQPSAVIRAPGPDVPAECAAFSGVWVGDWPNVGKSWLWISFVSKQCDVEYEYLGNPRTPYLFKDAAIKNGILEIPRSTGVTRFKLNEDGTMSGNYSGSAGTNSAMLRKLDLSDGSLTKLVEVAVQKPSGPVPPASNVPAECAAFFGKWVADWEYVGRTRLHVARVEPSCEVQYSYPRPSPSLLPASIVGGVLKIQCGRGSCFFTSHGDTLWARYSDSDGRSNQTVFKKE